MKRIMISILIAICNLLTIYAQDVINPPKFTYFSSTAGRYDTLINRSARPYVLGYNWGSQGARLDSALQMNTYHDFPLNSSNCKENSLVIQNTYIDTIGNVYKITAGHDMNVVLNAHCLHLEPTLTIDSTENFQPRFGDTTGAVFGWLNKSTGDTVGLGNDDFSRFRLTAILLQLQH